MDKYVITGGSTLHGTITVSGSKNVALKALVAACLTDEEVVIENVPDISDFSVMVNSIKNFGGEVRLNGHTAYVKMTDFRSTQVSLDDAAHTRTSSMFLAPLLIRAGKALIPNPGGCRLGARPIDRTVEGISKMGAKIVYDSTDGYFHASSTKLKGIPYRFEKNTHTGTETMIIAASMAEGQTILENAALEPEVDELVSMLKKMGAQIRQTDGRKIIIDGVPKLHGSTVRIGPDRNEIVTFAVAALVTKGDVFIKEAKKEDLKEFLGSLTRANGGFEVAGDGIRFFYRGELVATDVTTMPYPGFMTDWQAPWAVLMTQAMGESIIHETVFENRFSYVSELKKMGARISLFNPKVENPKEFYNFNMEDDDPKFFHTAKISGPTQLHNAVVNISDLRAGATLVIAALAAKGESVVHGIPIIQRGYASFDERLRSLGANIQVKQD
ncbi:MAG: UDP-N-acetylglucosamine 1-carboxyvinyltransferase [Candidatus Levybacteria bacterium]|nr:UDP-N-acetylglucosamine 1-carboxyvinyltransferase [Candidatus Levybacteria bacterium]